MVRYHPFGPAGRSLLRSLWGVCAILVVLVLGLASAPASAQPTVTDLRPEHGVPGDTLRIYGAGFDATPSNNTVQIGGTTITPDAGSATRLSVAVPGGERGPVTVQVDNGDGAVAAPERYTVITGGTGTFAPDSSLTPLVEGDVARGDLDGDGDLDLLVTGTAGDGNPITQLYVNNGGGSFTEASAGLPDLQESTVDLGDVDNDGDLDVLLTGSDGSTSLTRLYTKDDNGLSYSNSGITFPDFKNGGAALGDVEGDGDLDIVLAGNNNESAEAVLYTNELVEEGSLDFTQETTLTGTVGSSVDLGDVNGDGALDLVITGEKNDGDPSSTLYINDGGGTSFSSTTLSPAVQNGSVAVGDVNNDGSLDLVVSGNTTTGVESELLRNDGDGTFTSAQSLKGAINGSTTFGDVNADGHLDLLITGRDFSDFPETTILYKGDGSSTSPFSPTAAGLTEVAASAAVLGDLNGNGQLTPFIAGAGSSGPTATLYRAVLTSTNNAPPPNTPSVPLSSNVGLGFSAPVAALSGLADSIDVTGTQSGALDGTVSGAGTDSLVYDPTRAFAPGEQVSVTLRPGIESTTGVSLFVPTGFRFRAAAPSGPAAFPVRREVSDDETGAREVATGFLTSNGHLDLVVTASGDDEITLYEGNGDGSFASGTTIDSGVQYARALALADVTGDGLLDIIVGEGAQGTNTGSGDQVRLYENQGGGSFGSSQTVAGSSVIDDVRALATADLDQDGHQDVVSVSANNDRVNAHFNDGQGTSFTTTPIDQGANAPRAVALADVDRNGTMDVVVGSASNNKIVWYPNQGDGSFASAETIWGSEFTNEAAVNPRSLRTANLDGDEPLEIVSAERGDDGSAGDGAVAVYDASFFGGSLSGWSKTSVSATGADSMLAVAPADVNADGQIDIVAGSVNGDSLVWYENTTGDDDNNFGGISFAQGRTIDPGRPGVQDVVAADFDGDGSLDPAVAGFGTNTVATYPNVEPLQIADTTPARHALGVDTSLAQVEITFNKPLDAATADPNSVLVNGEQTGRISVSSVGASGNTLTLEPTTPFQPGEEVSVSVRADSVAGTSGARLDSTETFSFTAATASGSGTFTAANLDLADVDLSGVDWGDMDGDGDLDLALIGDSTSRATIIYENTGGSFSKIDAGLTPVDQGTIQWGDYDNDGDLDLLLSGSTGSGYVTEVYRNDGGSPPSFTLVEDALPGVFNSAVDWGDMNGDGRLDLVLSGEDGGGTVVTEIYRNNGDSDDDGTVEFRSSNAGLAKVSNGAVEWGDYDNDGDLDLLLNGSDNSTRKTLIYRNEGDTNGDGITDFAQAYSLLGVRRSAASWADIDGDTDLDLAISGKDGASSWKTQIYENDVENSNGFQLVTELNGGEESTVDWGDFDGDDDPDLFVTGYDGAEYTARLYENTDSGFSLFDASSFTGVTAGDVDWGDVDGDGILDLLLTGRPGAGAVTTVYRQASVPQITSTTPSRNAAAVDTALAGIDVTFNKTPDTDSVTAGDIRVVGGQTGPIPEADDSVGVSGTTLTYELGRSLQPGETVTVSLLADSLVATDGTRLPSTNTFQFTTQVDGNSPGQFPVDNVISGSATNAHSAVAADIERDGDLDVISASKGDNIITWAENDGSGTLTFVRSINTGASGVEHAIPADINGDDSLDVVSAEPGDGTIAWYPYNGSAEDSFGNANTITNSAGNPESVAAGDLDGDGDLDVVGALQAEDAIAVYENTDSGFLSGKNITSSALGAQFAALADLNGDGDLDVIAASQDDNTISWFENDGTGTFSSEQELTTSAESAEWVRAVDLNGDGALDVLGASNGDNTISWFENTGGGSFSGEKTITTNAAGAQSVATGDLDGDGDLDVIGAAYAGDTVAWYENNGDGTFSDAQPITTADGPLSVTTGDIDGDGTLDVIHASENDNTVAWHPNTTIAPQVVTEPASDTTDNSFTAEAAVNPGGLETSVTFQYGTDTSFGPDTTVTATTSLTGDDTTAVNATISGLDPATTYYYRVRASNSVGNTTGIERSVTTDVAPPTTVNDTVTTPEDTPVAVDVLSNDTVIAPLDTSTLAVQTTPPLGSTSVDPSNGTITYTPAPDSTDPVQFGYTVADDSGNVSNEATVTVTVTPVNDPPTARPDTFVTADGQPLNVAAPGVLANDTDLEGDAFSVTGLDQAPAHGDATIQADGAFTYTPNDGYLGPDSLTYTVADANGATSTGTVRLTVREATLQAGTDTSRFAPRRLNQPGLGDTLTVSNPGAVTLTNITATIGGANANDFTIANAGGSGPLAPGDARTYTVAFTPSAPGLREATLEVTAAEEDTTRTVALRGRGVDVAVRAGPAELGSDASVALSIEGGFAPTDGRLFFRAGGTDTYRDTALTGGPSDSLRARIPQDAVTTRGLDYYVVLTGDAETLTLPAGGPAAAAAQPRHLPTTFETLSPPTALQDALFQPETYRMISVPARPNGGIKAALKSAYGGSYAPARWRLERWDASEQDYRGYPRVDRLQPGDGFWLTTAEGTGFSLPAGQTPPADTARTLRLEAGWNQIGTPFGFAVPWDTIQAASPVDAAQIDGPVGYANGTFQPGQAALAPWKGYFVYNATGQPDTLVVPPVGPATNKSGAASPRPEAQLARARLPGLREPASTQSSERAGAPNDDRYTLRVEARSADDSAAVHLGLWPEAKTGRGPYDHAQPPALNGGVRLGALQKVGGRTVPHTYSMKPPQPETNGGGRHWTLRLSAPHTDGVQRTKLRLRDRGTLPDGYRRYILDLTAGRRIAPGAELSVRSGDARRLKVIVGTRRYAQQNNEGVSLESLQTALRGNYPNPFSEQTTVEYVLSKEQPVTIEVYDVLGRRVRTLVDDRQALGVHRASLKARRLGSGVYFLRLRAGDASDTKKVVLVK